MFTFQSVKKLQEFFFFFPERRETWRRITRHFFFVFLLRSWKWFMLLWCKRLLQGWWCRHVTERWAESLCFTQTVHAWVTFRFALGGTTSQSEVVDAIYRKKMNSLQMSQVPFSHRTTLCVSPLRRLAMRDKRNVVHNESSLSAVLTQKKKKEKLSPFHSWHLRCLILCLSTTTVTMTRLSFFAPVA